MKIQLPKKEWYTIDEVAQRWECTKDDVLHYIQILVLLPSFYLDHVRCRVRRSPLDIDSLELAPVKTCTGLYSPLLFVNDGDIGFLSTRKQWECCLEESVLVRGAPILHDEDSNIENVEMFSPVELVPKTFDDFLISRKELQRFEEKAAKQHETPESSAITSNTTDTQAAVETVEELCERLKASDLPDYEIAAKLLQAFPKINPSRISRLIAPDNNITIDAHRKRGKKLLETAKERGLL